MKFVDIELPSNRKFGFFFTAIFAAVSIYFVLKLQHTLSALFAIFALVTLSLSLFKPELLLLFNRLWMRLGYLLGKIISPIILGIIFYVMIVPVAVITRLAGRDELRLKHKDRDSHWKVRSPIGPEPSSFKHQF
tara:strand:- start:92 stop:493 length:402 start_codon:yes stop_codon:yes gene_type:complete